MNRLGVRLVLTVLGTVGSVAGCGDGDGAADPSNPVVTSVVTPTVSSAPPSPTTLAPVPSSAAEPAGSTSAPVGDGGTALPVERYTDFVRPFSVQPPNSETHRQTDNTDRVVHWVYRDVVPNPEGAQWADVYVWAPEFVVDPDSSDRQPVPDDLGNWLADHPGLEIILDQPSMVDGRPGRVLDVDRVEDEDPAVIVAGSQVVEIAGCERLVVVDVDGVDVVVEASTFRGCASLPAPDQPGDLVARIVETLRFNPDG